LILALTLLLAACQPTFLAPASLSGTATAPASATAVLPSATSAPDVTLPTSAGQLEPPTQTPQAGLPARLPEPPPARTKYRLEARLDYAQHRLAVSEQVEYTNTTGQRLSSLLLVIEALRYPGCFQLGRIFDAAGERVSSYRFEGTTLFLPLSQPLEPDQSTSFKIEYALQLNKVGGTVQGRPHTLGYSDLQANFGDWYPFVPPYQDGQGWLIHPAAAFGEHLVYDVADFEVFILPEGAQGGLRLAASAPTAEIEQEASGPGAEQAEAYHYLQPASRSFAWSASPYYDVLTKTVQIEGGSQVVVSSYFFSYHAEAGASLLETLAESLELYSKLFGPYRHSTLAAVQAEFTDGMEYDGLFFLSTDFYNWHKDTPEDFLTALGAHETAHMWWMGLVGSDQALEPWLDEALCTYSERLYFENLHPEAQEWWWTWRVNYYEPSGPIDIQIYDIPEGANQWRRYRDPVYLGGAKFLDELRLWMGDEAFFAGLREYAARYAYRQADGPGFLEVMGEYASQDLAAVVQRYFREEP
jgi:hypothetical protein